jgi:hypothetical protein
MKIFQLRKDDFAEIAADPVRRQATIERLTRLHRKLDWLAFISFVVALLLALDHRWEAVCAGLVALSWMFIAGQIHADLHLLQVMSKFYEKPSA